MFSLFYIISNLGQKWSKKVFWMFAQILKTLLHLHGRARKLRQGQHKRKTLWLDTVQQLRQYPKQPRIWKTCRQICMEWISEYIEYNIACVNIFAKIFGIPVWCKIILGQICNEFRIEIWFWKKPYKKRPRTSSSQYWSDAPRVYPIVHNAFSLLDIHSCSQDLSFLV